MRRHFWRTMPKMRTDSLTRASFSYKFLYRFGPGSILPSIFS
jgi:hypothetical protein